MFGCCWACVMLLATAMANAGEPLNWKEHRNKDYDFRVLFPGEPEFKIVKQPNVPDVKIFLVAQKGRLLMVNVADLPEQFFGEKETEHILDQATKGAANGVKGKVEKETKVAIGGTLPGREVLLSSDAGFFRLRCFFVNGRLYQLWTGGSEDWVKGAESNKFLDSFMLASGAGQPLEWKEYRDKDNNFKVQFPGEPKAIVNKQPNGSENKFFMVEHKDLVFAVIVTDLPQGRFASEKTTENALDGGVKAAPMGVKGKLEKETKITIAGTLRGREILLSAHLISYRVRVFYVNGRVYQLWLGGPPDRLDGPQIQHFLDSFMLTQ